MTGESPLERCRAEIAAARELAQAPEPDVRIRCGILIWELDWWVTMLDLEEPSSAAREST